MGIKIKMEETYQEGVVGAGIAHLLSIMNTSKIHLHVEQFSLKTDWRLIEERLLYNQG